MKVGDKIKVETYKMLENMGTKGMGVERGKGRKNKVQKKGWKKSGRN